MIFRASKQPISDTVEITPDGGIVVDIRKLLNKDEIQRMMSDIRSRTKVVERSKDRSRSSRPA